MGSLRVADVDSIQENGNLFLRAASDADIRLGTDGTALAYIDASNHFQ